jgi:hypothetical protein
MNVNFLSLSNITLIVVHGGQTSHQDEQIAAALAVAYGAANRVERRDPMDAELADPTTLVLDVGGQDNWSARNVDHHQLPREATDCAFSLLAKHLDCWVEMTTVFPWASLAVELDQHGPFALAKKIGCSADSFFAMLGPARSYHDLRWAADAQYRAEYTAWLADHLRVQLSLYAEMEDFAYADPYMPEIAGLKVLRGDKVEAAHPEHARELTDMLAKEYKVDVVVFNDDRGDGFGLLRMGDNPAINFAKCEGMAAVKFAHKGGFILKTVDKTADIEAIIKAAIA